jgi:hypothetical protein
MIPGLALQLVNEGVRDAVAADNAGLRALARACPMDGDIGLCVDRSPDFFRLCGIGNAGFRVGVIDGADGTPLGCATVAERHVWLDGHPARLAYACDLKVHPTARGTDAAPRLVRWVVERSRDIVGNIGPVLLNVLSGNLAMERLCTGGRGLPKVDRFATLRAYAVPIFRRRVKPSALRVQVATGAEHSELQALWTQHAPARQLAPLLPVGLELGSQPGGEGFTTPRHFIARNAAGRAVGFLGVWDERAVKQLRVTGYSLRLGAARAVVNVLAPLLGAERLPRKGAALASGTVVDLCVPKDAPDVLRALLLEANRNAVGSGLGFLTIGLDVRDPLCGALRGLHAQATDFSACISAPSGRYQGSPLNDRLVHFEPALG